jgi:antitoxin component YwqK of YwqJK toxin-antitoxin module
MNTSAFGIVATLDSLGKYFYINADKNEIITPKYAREDFLPQIKSGKKNTDCRIKLSNGKIKYVHLWPYEKEPFLYKLCYLDTLGHLNWYEDTANYFIFYKDGSLKENRHFINKKWVYTKGFYPSGKLQISRDSFSEITYYKDGTLKSNYSKLNGENFGPFTTFYPNGQLHEKGSYDTIYHRSKYTHLNNEYISYYYNGFIKSKGSYNGRNKLNNWEYYTPLGVKKEDKKTEVKFPSRYIDTTSLVNIIINKYNHIALVNGYIPGHTRYIGWDWNGLEYAELWDTKNNRQLESAIPMTIRPSGFLNNDVVCGQSLRGDVYGYHILNYNEKKYKSSNSILTGNFLLHKPEQINDTTGIVYYNNKLVLYQLDSLTILQSFPNANKVQPYYEDYTVSKDRKKVYLLYDTTYFILSLPELNILEQIEFDRPKILNDGKKMVFLNDVIITYNTNSENIVANIIIQDIHKPNNQIKVINHSVLYHNDRDYYKDIWTDSSLFFIGENKKNKMIELQYNLRGKNYQFVEHIIHKKTEVFDPNKYAPKRRINVQFLSISNNNLDFIGMDSSLFVIDLTLGKVKYSNKKSTQNFLDTIIMSSYANQEIQYLENIQISKTINFDEDIKIKAMSVSQTKIDKDIFVVGDQLRRLILQNRVKKKIIEQYVFFDINEEGNYLFMTPDQFYMGSKDIKDIVFFKKGDEYFEFNQFDLKYNRPDIILDRLGYADSSLISAYHQAYLKRLKKMNFTEDMLKDDFHLPEIKIENFEEMPTIMDQGSIDIKLDLKDSKYKLDRINVWVNDVAVYGTNGISLRDKAVQEYKTNLKVNLVKGKNKVQVSVLNQAGAESYKETFEIECKVGKDKPNLYLITIGESKFKQANYNLTYAAKDAHDVATLFTKSKVYEKVITKTLTNEQVTKENIAALRGFLDQAGINDEVMIFIAGHGVLDENLDYFFASYDMDFNNPNQRGIAYEDLEGLLDGIKPLKKVLLIDACHSGEIDKDEVVLLAANEVQEGEIQFRAVGNSVKPKLGMQNTSELTKALFTDLRKGTGATVISSAGGGEYAMESGEWKNGLFTYCMLKGIETKAADLNSDGEIWLKELQEYVQTQVSELSGGKQQPTSRIENSVLDYRVW